MKGLAADLKHAVRVYLNTPGLSALAVIVLAVAMAIVTAFLSLYSDLALKAAPGFEPGGNLISVGQTNGRDLLPISYNLIQRINEEAQAIDSIAGVATVTQYYERDPDAEREEVTVEAVTERYVPDIRPILQLGRAFEESDHDTQAAPVVVLSDGFWRREFGARPDVLGQTMRIYGPNFVLRSPTGEARAADQFQDYRIVGVFGPELEGTFRPGTDLWMPYRQAAEVFFGAAGPNYVNLAQLVGLAQLARGATADSARTELNGRYGEAGFEVGLQPNMQLDTIDGIVLNLVRQRETLRQVRLFLAGSVLLALVAACNVSLFLLSRAPGRRRELAIRMSVGAPLKRLARQLMTEAGLIAVSAAALGLLASAWLAVFMRGLPFLQGGEWRNVTPLDWRVLALVVVMTLLLTVLVSLAPVTTLRKLGLAAGARAVTARAGIAQQLAGTLQIAIAGVIGAAALAFAWYLADLGRMDPGFSAPDVYAVTVTPDNASKGFDVNQSALLLDRERRRDVIAALPGVDGVGFGTSVPGLLRGRLITQLAPEDDPENGFLVDIHAVDPGYFELLGTSLLDGVEFSGEDPNQVVVNETLAERVWGRTDVVGEAIPMRAPPGVDVPRREVVGVIKDIAFGHPRDDPVPMMFFPVTGASAFEMILIKTRASIADIRAELQGVIDRGNLPVTIQSIQNIEETWGRGLAPDRARTWLTVVSALIVVVLAAFGFYGTQRFLVAAGRREYAILAALGAGPRALGRLVLKRGLLLGLPGLVLGTLLAFIVVAWMRGDFVFGDVSPTAIAAAVGLGIVGLVFVATFGPARQASNTEPAPLLKEE